MGWFGFGAKNAPKALKGFGIFRKIWIFFLIVLAFTILLNAIVISIQEKDIKPGLVYLGNKLLSPTLALGEESNKILDNKGIYFNEEGNIIKNLFETVLIYSALFSSLFMIFIWFYVLYKLFGLLSNTNPIINLFLASISFFGIQMLLLSIMGKDIMIPINCFIDFFKALPYIITPFSKVGDRFIDGVDITKVLNNSQDVLNNTINNTLNNTLVDEVSTVVY